MIHRYGSAILCLFAAVTAGCGGVDRGRATSSLDDIDLLDIGSQPVQCSVTKDYEFQTIQDFETGSVTDGWYFNNDQCDKCQKVVDRIKEVNNLLNARLLPWSTEDVSYADKWGCTDWGFYSDDPDVVAKTRAKYDKEIETLRQKLVDGDPENNVPPDCQKRCNESQTPIPTIKPILASRIEFYEGGDLKDKPRCGSRFAMHVKSETPFQTWGGSVAVQLGQPGLDASDWDGLSFWARVGPTSRHPLRIEISDVHTDDKQMVYTYEGAVAPTLVTIEDLLEWEVDESTGEEKVVGLGYFDAQGDKRTWCNKKNYIVSQTDTTQTVNEKFICNADSTRDDRNGCDKFGANRSMTGDWQFYTLDFMTMRQSGWGRSATDSNGNPVGLDKSQLRSINFMWTTGNWDVWIDDVALYRRKQP